MDGIQILTELASVSDQVDATTLFVHCHQYIVVNKISNTGFLTKVTLASARKVTLHVQSVSEMLWKPSLDEETLNSLVDLLSQSLKATVSGDIFTEDTAHSGGCPDSYGGRPALQRQAMQLLTDTLEMASDLILVGGNNHELWKCLSLN